MFTQSRLFGHFSHALTPEKGSNRRIMISRGRATAMCILYKIRPYFSTSWHFAQNRFDVSFSSILFGFLSLFGIFDVRTQHIVSQCLISCVPPRGHLDALPPQGSSDPSSPRRTDDRNRSHSLFFLLSFASRPPLFPTDLHTPAPWISDHPIPSNSRFLVDPCPFLLLSVYFSILR